MAKIIVVLSRVLVGATFVFSGFVKAVDPLGFTYKIQDYLIELGLTSLFPLALPVAVLMVTAEFALGVFLLLGIYRKWTTRLILLFMIFFTPFTLWVAITNPVKDCGCFGDAFVISNWQTLYKNLLLLTGAVWLMLKWRHITPLFTKKAALPVAIATLLLGVLFALYNVYRLPVIDFRPYKVGANIPLQMYVDPEKADLYETIFIYSKDGVIKEFNEENYPWNDSTWTFVDMKTHLVRAGQKPKIEDFSVESLYFDDTTKSWQSGGDITDIILSDPSYTFLMIAYSLDEMHMRHLDRFREVARHAEEKGYSFYLLTASDPGAVGEWERKQKTGFQFVRADERTLKTMIRSNPGLMLLKEGTVMGKWDDSEVPSNDKIELILK
ncbi:MAG: DoxX family protein [Porphyromonadaceae bacterium]|nr:DoxX family protein [Porphyromonadaceae bacterium]